VLSLQSPKVVELIFKTKSEFNKICSISLRNYVFHNCNYSWFWIVRRHTIATLRALVDLWQLAFSLQDNPLAAVQPFSAATSHFSSGKAKYCLQKGLLKLVNKALRFQCLDFV